MHFAMPKSCSLSHDLQFMASPGSAQAHSEKYMDIQEAPQVAEVWLGVKVWVQCVLCIPPEHLSAAFPGCVFSALVSELPSLGRQLTLPAFLPLVLCSVLSVLCTDFICTHSAQDLYFNLSGKQLGEGPWFCMNIGEKNEITS